MNKLRWGGDDGNREEEFDNALQELGRDRTNTQAQKLDNHIPRERSERCRHGIRKQTRYAGKRRKR